MSKILTSAKETAYESYGKYMQNLSLRLDTVTATGGQNSYVVELTVWRFLSDLSLFVPVLFVCTSPFNFKLLIYLCIFSLDKILEGSICSDPFNSQEIAVEAKVGVVVTISSKS